MLFLLKKGINGEKYNIVGNKERVVKKDEIAKAIMIWGIPDPKPAESTQNFL